MELVVGTLSNALLTTQTRLFTVPIPVLSLFTQTDIGTTCLTTYDGACVVTGTLDGADLFNWDSVNN
jgi:hypothetical protein